LQTTIVTGGTGFLGRRLVPRLVARGERVTVLARKAQDPRVPQGATSEAWQPEQRGDWYRHLDGARTVIHLAGEPVFDHLVTRWTDEKKRRIHDSRVESTRRVVEAIGEAKQRPEVLLCASATGYYGARSPDEVLTEESAPGHDFLAGVVRDWEAAAVEAEKLGVRVIRLRIGIVLGEDGGALAQMVPLFRAFVGGPVGSGEQIMSWVHADDIVNLSLFVLDHPEISGAVNAVAPSPVSMDVFAHALGHALHRPSLIRTPAIALKLLLGEAADPILTGQRVLPRAAERHGYTFAFTNIDQALGDVFGGSP
jgi:hypothetical protein